MVPAIVCLEMSLVTMMQVVLQIYAGIAQLVEQLFCKQRVVRSNRTASSSMALVLMHKCRLGGNLRFPSEWGVTQAAKGDRL